MPFKIEGRPNYYVQRTVAGFGRIGPYSTGQRNLRVAERMERLLVELPFLGHRDVVRLLLAGRVTLADVWVAYLSHELGTVSDRLTGGTVADWVDAYWPHESNRNARLGLKELRAKFADEPSFLLQDPRNLRQIIAEAVAGDRKKGTIRITLWQGLSKLLTYHLGRARRNEIMAEVPAPSEDDTREVRLQPEEVRHLLSVLDPLAKPIVVAAILTGVDKGPLLRALVRDFDAKKGVLYARDTKNKYRRRNLDLSESAQALLRECAKGKGLNESLFSISVYQLWSRWEKARQEAGLDWLRFKDLRHVFSDGWVAAGGSLEGLRQYLGHSRNGTTLRYTTGITRGGRAQANEVASFFGFGLTSEREVGDGESDR